MHIRKIGMLVGLLVLVILAATNPPSRTPRVEASSFAPNVPFISSWGEPSIAALTLTTKKGVGLTYNHCADVRSLRVSWQYDWSPTPVGCSTTENVPMIWGQGDMSSTLGGNSQWIMGFNEPDQPSQSNLTPAAAAQLWHTLELKYPKRKLLAPVPSQADPYWILDFRNAYFAAYQTYPRLDGLAMHCYGLTAQYCIPLAQWYEARAAEWQVPEVWVTEFAFFGCLGNTQSQAIQEMNTFITWINSQPQITRYAWFAARIRGTESWAAQPPACNMPLVNYSTGYLTGYGRAYAKR